MMSPTRSCCQTVHLMPSCCGSIAQAHHDHWEVLEIVVATLKSGVHPWPLKIGIRHRSLARLKCVVEDDLGFWELALKKLVSATDSSLWMTLDDELCSEPPPNRRRTKASQRGKLKRQSEKQTERKPKAKGRKRGRDTTAQPSSRPRQKCETPHQATQNQPIKHPQNHHKRFSRVPPGLQSTNPE